MDLNIEQNETILLRTKDVLWISDKGQKLEDFVLTDQGLYCFYTEKKSFFAKPEDMVYRFEISDIIKDEEASHIEQVRAKNERCIQIEFKHGMEHFSFQRVPKAIMDQWFTVFRGLLGVPDLTTIQKERNKEMLSNLAGDVMEGMGTLLGVGSRAIHDKIEQIAEYSRTANNRSAGSTTSRSYTESKSTGSGNSEYQYTYYEESVETPKDSYYEERIETPKDSYYEESVETPQDLNYEESVETPQNLYYLAIDGQPKGPFRLDEIAELAISGQINRETLAWTKGMDNWQAMNEVEGLNEIVESMPPTLK